MSTPPKPPPEPDLPAAPSTPPPPPEPPASQPPLPPAPPPDDFPTSSDQTEANFRTTGLVVWIVIAVALIGGFGLIAFGARNGVPNMPGRSSDGNEGGGFRMPSFSLPQFDLPEFRLPSSTPNDNPEGADKLENPPNLEAETPPEPWPVSVASDPDPVGRRVDKPRSDVSEAPPPPPAPPEGGPSQQQATVQGNAIS